MEFPVFAHLSWRARRIVRNVSGIGVLAIGLLVFDAGFYASSVQPALRLNADLREQVKALQADPMHQALARAENGDPQAELAAFYAAMARPRQVPDLLRRLHRVAADQGLDVEEGEYRPSPDAGGRLLRYQITLPATGTYPEVRRFLAQASRELPALALEGLTFQRRHIGDELLQAQIRFTLFVEGQGGPG